jgi:hypothetical protein
MTSLPDSVRTVLESPALAHLVTLNPDGSPQVSIVWVGLDGDEIVAGHLPEHRKVRNVRRDSRVALSIEAGGRNAISAPKSASRPWTTRHPDTSPASLSTASPVSAPGPHPADTGYRHRTRIAEGIAHERVP